MPSQPVRLNRGYRRRRETLEKKYINANVYRWISRLCRWQRCALRGCKCPDLSCFQARVLREHLKDCDLLDAFEHFPEGN